jgi:hypothetical protein
MNLRLFGHALRESQLLRESLRHSETKHVSVDNERDGMRSFIDPYMEKRRDAETQRRRDAETQRYGGRSEGDRAGASQPLAFVGLPSARLRTRYCVMNTPTCFVVLLMLFCAIFFPSCADQPLNASKKNLKLEQVPRPLGGPPVYVYRQEPAGQ